MNKRNYNVFFNTHTVSGIVISVALYIVFFAGAFALFKDEIVIWENGIHQQHTERRHIDYDYLLEGLSEKHHLTSRDIRFNLGKLEDDIYLQLGVVKDTLQVPEKDRVFKYLSVNIHDANKQGTYSENYTIGEFLYRLHFFHQIPNFGIYLAGFVAFFFLFAIVTGVIVHWKKIVSNFYQFSPKSTLKRVWTDAHTALGIIGLPFQFVFAVTGAYFCLSILVLIPANILYGGNQQKLMEDLRPELKTEAWQTVTTENLPSLNDFVKKASATWDDFTPTYLVIKNYMGTNMKYLLLGELPDSKRFLNRGAVEYNFKTKETSVLRNPNNANYTYDIQQSVGRLHFANYGGLATRIVYFILALITCFVIISGVLIWIEARNKKSMTIRQRLYTAKVGHIYLAICLSMLPVTALAFLFVKLTNSYFVNKQTVIYYFYFITWLIAILFFRFKRDNYFTNKYCLLLGAILGFLIPIVNGMVSGNWIWVTFLQHQFDILLVDIVWLIIASASLLFFLKIKPNIKAQSSFNKNPIDYKNRKTLLAEEAKKSTKKPPTMRIMQPLKIKTTYLCEQKL